MLQNCSRTNARNFWFCWKRSPFLLKKEVTKLFSCAASRVDLQMVIQEGCFGKIDLTSSLMINHLIDNSGGLIDSNFRRIIEFILFNHYFKPYLVHIGNKMAQLTSHKTGRPIFIEITNSLELREVLKVLVLMSVRY